MTPVLQLSVSNNLAEIALVTERFEAFSADHQIADGVRRAVLLALDELLNNVVSYGYDDTDEHRIKVRVAVVDGALEVTIEDDGRAYDPFAQATPDLDADIDERDIGGLGVHLVRSLMDTTSYVRRADSNVVVITKRL